MNKYPFEFKKKYGQNFLTDINLVKKIASSAGIKEESLVIEIGPGAGILTKELANLSKQVLAYEIDERLEEILDIELKDYPNVDVVFDDFLKRNLKEDLLQYDYKYLYVVSNLPYYITTPIITKIIEDEVDVCKIVVMVQKEVGDRFCALPSSNKGGKDYNSLTVFLNYYFNVEKLFVVNRNNFVPKPNVDSVVVSLTKKEELLFLTNKDKFFQLVRDSFKFKRKTLRNNLKSYDLLKIEEVLKKHNLDLSVRAEQLPLELFVEISNYLF